MSPVRALRTLLVTALACALLAPSAMGAEYDPNTVLVKFKSGTSADSAAGVAGVGQNVGRVGGVGVNVLRVSGDPGSGGAQAGEPPLRRRTPSRTTSSRTSATPNDPLFPDEYGLHNTGQTGGTLGRRHRRPRGLGRRRPAAPSRPAAARASASSTPASTGRTPTSPASTAGCATSYTAGTTIVNGVCDDDNGHGTHVAGTIAANTNNDAGVAGVAQLARS